jgi:hypothetical protein
MKKNIVLFLILSFLSTAVWSQKVIWGPLFTGRNPKGFQVSDILATTPTSMVVEKASNNGILHQFVAYDEQMNITSEAPISMSLQNTIAVFRCSIENNGTLYAFGSYYDSKAKQNKLVLSKYDGKTFAPKGSPEIFMSVDSKPGEYFASFYAIASEDNSHVALITLRGNQLGQNSAYGVHVKQPARFGPPGSKFPSRSRSTKSIGSELISPEISSY